MEGAERDGATGFVKGVGKGVVGLFTKPLVGAFDFMSTSTEGIRNTTTVFDQDALDKARLPRFIAADGVIRVSLGCSKASPACDLRRLMSYSRSRSAKLLASHG